MKGEAKVGKPYSRWSAQEVQNSNMLILHNFNRLERILLNAAKPDTPVGRHYLSMTSGANARTGAEGRVLRMAVSPKALASSTPNPQNFFGWILR